MLLRATTRAAAATAAAASRTVCMRAQPAPFISSIAPTSISATATATAAYAKAKFSSSSIAQSKIGRKVLKCPSDVVISVQPYDAAAELRRGGTAATTARAHAHCKQQVVVTGPKGTLSMPLQPFVSLTLSGSKASTENEVSHTGSGTMQLQQAGDTSDASTIVSVSVADAAAKAQRAMWGTTRALVANMVTGVSEGFLLPLRLVGVGYRAQIDTAPVAPGDDDDVSVIVTPISPTAVANAGATQVKRVLTLRLGYAHPIVLDIPAGVDVSIPVPQRILLQGIDLPRISLFAAQIRKWRKPEPYNQKGVFVGDETIKKKDGKKR